MTASVDRRYAEIEGLKSIDEESKENDESNASSDEEINFAFQGNESEDDNRKIIML